MNSVNLHVHTNASDGLFPPEEVVKKAKQHNLKAIAVTDHDTVQGLTSAEKAGKEFNLEVIRGVELSLEVGDKATCHLLGYFIPDDQGVLVDTLIKISKSRELRNQAIIDKLKENGIELDYDQLKEKYSPGNSNMGRMHIAQALVDKEFVKTYQQAFDKYLKKGKCCYQERFRLTPENAVELIHQSGGLAVLAHPGEGYPSEKKMKEIFSLLLKAGLDGIEVYYPRHTYIQTLKYSKMAEDHHLLKTGGTDFHGFKGRDQWNLTPPLGYEVVERMKKRRKKYDSS
ncbi:MAG: PHP domain-containing protein [bacterium]